MIAMIAVQQFFYGAAMFFSVLFVWQFIAALMGLTRGEADADADAHLDVEHIDADATCDHFEHGAHVGVAETVAAFKILSIRSIITFCTLFTWGTALYLGRGRHLPIAMSIASIWGLVGMFSIALIFYMMPKLTKTGTINIRTCVGTNGTVYLDIAQDGMGEIRATVSGRITYVKARGAYGQAMKSGTPVRVVRCLNQTTVEVEPL